MVFPSGSRGEWGWAEWLRVNQCKVFECKVFEAGQERINDFKVSDGFVLCMTVKIALNCFRSPSLRQLEIEDLTHQGQSDNPELSTQTT